MGKQENINGQVKAMNRQFLADLPKQRRTSFFFPELNRGKDPYGLEAFAAGYTGPAVTIEAAMSRRTNSQSETGNT